MRRQKTGNSVGVNYACLLGELVGVSTAGGEMLDTSGIMIEEKEDGTIELFFADYDVEEFGGHDFECTITLDKDNSDKFREALAKDYKGTLKEMVVEAFTWEFSMRTFSAFCRKNGIKYDMSTWS